MFAGPFVVYFGCSCLAIFAVCVFVVPLAAFGLRLKETKKRLVEAVRKN